VATSFPQSIAAEAAFLTRLRELGATLLEPDWLGTRTPHRVRCAYGHECQPRPESVKRGQGICRTCAGNDPAASEAKFRAALAKLGAVLVEPGWLGSQVPHRVMCAAGHECRPRPTSVIRGQGVCRRCVGLDPADSEAAFRARLDELGVTLLGPYKDAVTPHRAKCAQGHACQPTPHHVVRGGGACRVCAGQDSAVSEAAFREALAAAGATLLEPYKNAVTPHRVRCAEGHECWPRPGTVRAGHGICAACAYKVWDVFYVVAHGSEPRVKFGITSGNGAPRLRTHRQHGYTAVVRLVTGLPGRVARDAEDAVRAALASAGARPVRGREYFDASCLGLILDVADSWLRSPDSLIA
jgi:hypothetical protein